MSGKKLDEIIEEFNIPHNFDPAYFRYVVGNVKRKGLIYKFVDEIVVDGLEKEDLQERAKKGIRLLYSSNHRSHIDYLVLGYIMATNGLPIPRFAAGQNLLIWPINRIIDFRRMGAFSIDRENKSYDYLKALYTHIEDMIIGGQHVLFFPEGGRSYNGEYLQPKTGLVRAVMGAINRERYANKELRVDVVPININYDYVAEKSVFPLLEKTKRTSRIGRVFYYLLDGYAIGTRYISPKKGKVYVKFGPSADIGYLGNNKKHVAEGIMLLIKDLDKNKDDRYNYFKEK